MSTTSIHPLEAGHFSTVLTVCIAIIVVIVVYVVLVLRLQREQHIKDNSRYLPEEEILYATRRHPIELVPACILGFLGAVGILVAISLVSAGNPMWWAVLAAALVAGVLGLHLYGEWHRFTYVLTDSRFVREWRLFPLLPWQTPLDDETPLRQILECDGQAGTLGSAFGWGKLTLKLQLHATNDNQTLLVLVRVPNYDGLSMKFREVIEARFGQSQFEKRVDDLTIQASRFFAALGPDRSGRLVDKLETVLDQLLDGHTATPPAPPLTSDTTEIPKLPPANPEVDTDEGSEK